MITRLSFSRVILLCCICVLMARVIAGKVEWHGQNWARACDFFANDLSNARTLPEHCGPKCEQTPGCTHFAWNGWNGGTCWMKHGSVSKDNAFSTSDAGMVCGVLGHNHNHGSNNRRSKYSVILKFIE